MKCCKECGVEQLEVNFYKVKTCKDGYSVICKKCHLKKYYIPSPNKKICKECKVPLTEKTGLNSGLKRKDGSTIYSCRCRVCIRPFRNKLARNRRRKNAQVRLYESIKTCIGRYLKGQITKKAVKYLGCSIEEYSQYLESNFTPFMNWGNYGTYWEIDHIHPLSRGGSFHYTNTRPLEISKNRSKRDKILT